MNKFQNNGDDGVRLKPRVVKVFAILYNISISLSECPNFCVCGHFECFYLSF